MNTSFVDLSFPVSGDPIPSDHGYALYGGISRLIPEVHGAAWLAIHGIGGRRNGESLSLENGRLRIRVPALRIGDLLALSGATIDVAGRAVRVGAPRVDHLTPAAILDARLVVIRLTGGIPKPFDAQVFEARFRDEANRQLVEHGVNGELALIGRQSLRVAGQRVIGYSVRVGGLTAEASLKLQISGVGGKRMMGCGVFRPARIRLAAQQVA